MVSRIEVLVVGVPEFVNIRSICRLISTAQAGSAIFTVNCTS